MKISAKRIVALLMALCMLFCLVGCKDNPTSDGSSEYEIEYEYVYEEETSSTDETSSTTSGDTTTQTSTPTASDTEVIDKEVSGTVTLGVSANEVPEMEYIMPLFKAKYPNVKVEIVNLASSLYGISSVWTSKAASKQLPDVVIGSERFDHIMSQGWAYPLDNLLAADENKDDVLEVGLDRYRYQGKLYALPFRIQFNSIFVNNDLLQALNLQKPSYDWNLSTFMSLAKAATTTTTSGINYIINEGEPTYGFDNKTLSAYLQDGYHQYGYNFETNHFSLSNNDAFGASQDLIADMRKEKGLISDELKGTEDYEKRFGAGADAFVSGKVLFGNHNTWELDWFKQTLQWQGDMYPVPTADNVPLRVQTHVDFVFMNSNLKEKQSKAAFALCRFLSYDEDGCIGRIDYNNNHSQKPENNGKYTFYAPTSESDKVLNYYKAQTFMPAGVRWMLEKVVKDPSHTLVADCNKVVPNFWQNVDQYREKVQNEIDNGQSARALVGDLESKINKAMDTTMANFNKAVKKNQDKFYKTHSYEAR